MSIVIERAQEEHRPAIMRLLEQANMHYIPSQEMPGLTYENYFVAMVEGQVVGFCGYKVLSATAAKTELMVVDREHRGEGIGYALQVQRMEDMLRRGIRMLATNTDLPETIEWYKKHFGYREIGTLQKFHEYGDPTIDHWTTLQMDLVEWAATRAQKE